MSRHLILVRHAKSAWNDPWLDDHDRPLAPRGVKALPHLLHHLASVPRPELVLCSTARRTAETFDGIRVALPQNARIEMDVALYGATVRTLLRRLEGVDNDISCSMVVGHNPALQDLALMLVGAGDPDMRAQLEAKLPTAATVVLSFDGPWADLGVGTARLDDLFVPRPPNS